jgi:hypothetical protein
VIAPANLLQLLLLAVSGWLQRHQDSAIEYIKAENHMLRERLRGRRLLFADAERREFARKAKVVRRKGLVDMDASVTLETLLRWHRELAARKSPRVQRRKRARPRTREDIVGLIRVATENQGGGYTRIQGALVNLKRILARGIRCAIF